MDVNGFYGDTFSSGFGDFYTAKKRVPKEIKYGQKDPYERLFSEQDGHDVVKGGLKHTVCLEDTII